MKQAVMTTRFSYMTPEIGGQLIFCVISFYLLKFYVDVYGLPVAAAGSILLIARCIDAIDAPLWGVLFEKVCSPLASAGRGSAGSACRLRSRGF